MTQMDCLGLIPKADSVIGHGLQEATDRLLIEWRDASVLGDQFFLFWSKQLPKRCGTPASQHKRCVDTLLFKSGHIAKVERISPQLIVFLGSPTHPKKCSKLCLI
ncbi:hypothetical protein PS874_04297 [Pseudomonas fluorescens]|nr:hypothetical protein PS874_04297 [Pseudomonas fluorescens]